MKYIFRWCYYCGKRQKLEKELIYVLEGLHTYQKLVDICEGCQSISRHYRYCTLTHTPGHCLDQDQPSRWSATQYDHHNYVAGQLL